MSRPSGPPPYTAAQIAGLSTYMERFRAEAELRSYIAGHRVADMRENGLRSPHPTYSTYHRIGNNVNEDTKRSDEGSGNKFAPAPNDDARESSTSTSKLVHGNNLRGSIRARGTGRGYSGYEPYPPSQQARAKFSNRSAVSNDTTPIVWSPKRCRQGTSAIDFRANHQSLQSSRKATKPTALCSIFTSTGIRGRIKDPTYPLAPSADSNIYLGQCTRTRCVDIHDTDKQAVCKSWLYKKECAMGGVCLLSHRPTANNTPHCLYHLQDRCTNSPCLFAHARISPTALVCEAFGRLGYCDMGDQCPSLHVYECPDFANKGTCAAGDKCSLRHAHNASRMKAAARHSPDSASPHRSPERASTEHIRNGTDSPDDPHAITQQHDYVPFDGVD